MFSLGSEGECTRKLEIEECSDDDDDKVQELDSGDEQIDNVKPAEMADTNEESVNYEQEEAEGKSNIRRQAKVEGKVLDGMQVDTKQAVDRKKRKRKQVKVFIVSVNIGYLK